MVKREFDPKKLSKVKLKDIRPNTWNPKDKDTKEYQNIKLGIEQKGVMTPIVVRENNGYEIIDGEQRYTATKELEYKDVWIYNEGQMSDEEAQELTIWYQQQAPFETIKEAKFITELHLKMPSLKLPYTNIQMQDMEDLTNFDFSMYNDEEPIIDDDEDVCRHCPIHCKE